jgi:hypothetical protein
VVVGFWPTGERRAKRDLVRGAAKVYATRRGDVAARYEEGPGGLAWRESYLQGSGLDEKLGRIWDLRRSSVSILPEGLERNLSQEEFRDLLAFLRSLR